MERVYQQAENYYADMLEDIRIAEHRIDLEVYSFIDDALGRQFIAALSHAAQRSVQVRVLVDGIGSGIASHRLLDKLSQAGVKTRIYRPLPWYFWQWAFAANTSSGFRKFAYLFNFMNRRNHRKVMVVDKHIVWLGSFNLCQEHLAQSQGGSGWRDSGVRLDSVNADELKTAFEAAWRNPARRDKHILKKPLSSGQFRLNYNRRLRRLYRKGILQHLGQAQHKVWVSNAYFIPSVKLLRALTAAAERGVDVRLMVPGHSDVFFMPWASALFYAQLLQAGVHIYEYQAGILHAKTLVVDHWVCLGSSNLNQRSWLHDLEVDAVLHEQQAVNSIEQQFLCDQLGAVEVGLQQLRKMGFIKRCIGRIALILRYWL